METNDGPRERMPSTGIISQAYKDESKNAIAYGLYYYDRMSSKEVLRFYASAIDKQHILPAGSIIYAWLEYNRILWNNKSGIDLKVAVAKHDDNIAALTNTVLIPPSPAVIAATKTELDIDQPPTFTSP